MEVRKDTSNLTAVPAFKYTPLPSASSIRLLEIMAENSHKDVVEPSYTNFLHDDVIKCNLSAIDLGQPVSYDALSYTWGNPLSVYPSKEDADKAKEIYTKQVPIICNGIEFMVNVNQYDALVLLRSSKRIGQPRSQQLHKDLPNDPVVKKHIWIDAICIDQNNTSERNSQVQMMDKIYKGASTVLIWLGPHDNFSRPACSVLSIVSNASMESAKNFSLPSTLDSFRSEDADVSSLSQWHWLCLFAFLERRWFQRSWVVQEIALARISIVMCGSLFLPWAGLSRAAAWLRESGCYPMLWHQGITRSMELVS
jgi:hypothetical protein